MSATETITWTADSEADKTLRDAVLKLGTSIDNGVHETAPGQPKRFVLASQHYFDLQAYVLSGEDFPQSQTAFDARLTKEAFKKLTDIDGEIYCETKEPMIGVGNTCAAFHRDHLARLLNAARDAMAYADTTTEQLTVDDGLSLRNQLDVLMDLKYKAPKDQDYAFRDAKAAAVMALQGLKDDADAKKAEIDSIVVAMNHFKDETMKYLPGVQKIRAKYKGPVTNQKTNNTPYLEWLNSDIAAKQKKLDTAIKNALAKYNEWVVSIPEAIASYCIPCAGWIMGPLKTKETVDLKNAYDELQRQVNAYKDDIGEEMTLWQEVTKLIQQCVDIEKKMENAISALGKLSGVFGDQSYCYSVISTYLSGLKNNTDYDGVALRSKAIMKSVDQTVKKLQELKHLAKQFTDAINQQITINL